MAAYTGKIVRKAQPLQVNPQSQATYTVQPAPGGVYHVYAGGRRVFVRAGQAATPAAPQAPQPGAGASAADQAAQLAPDSQYFSDSAQQTFQNEQQRAQIGAEGAADRTGYAETLRRMAAQQKQAQQNTTETANNQGLYYSGILGKRMGDLAKNYAQSRADTTENYKTRERAREAARRALDSGMTVDDAAMMAASADRQIGSDSEAASNNALTVNPAGPSWGPDPSVTPDPARIGRPPARTPIQKIARQRAFKTTTARGKVFHTYKTGRRVAVRKVR